MPINPVQDGHTFQSTISYNSNPQFWREKRYPPHEQGRMSPMQWNGHSGAPEIDRAIIEETYSYKPPVPTNIPPMTDGTRSQIFHKNSLLKKFVPTSPPSMFRR